MTNHSYGPETVHCSALYNVCKIDDATLFSRLIFGLQTFVISKPFGVVGMILHLKGSTEKL